MTGRWLRSLSDFDGRRRCNACRRQVAKQEREDIVNWILIAARFTIAVLLLSLMAGVGLALAQESEQQNEQAGGWSGYLVLGGGAAPDYEGSEDYQPIPFATGKIGYDDYYVELRGPGLRANVLPGGLLPFNLEFGPSIAYRGGRDDVDNDRIDDLRNIDSTVEMAIETAQMNRVSAAPWMKPSRSSSPSRIGARSSMKE